ncbi:MAG: DNA-binding NtrC family response regulator [Rickettsiales bacterium]|jgi:DNA-binding NtrC family response regulator
MNYGNVLVVDDEGVQAALMSKFVRDLDYKTLIMHDGEEVVEFFSNKNSIDDIRPSEISLMVLDLSMPKMDGLTVLRQIASIKGDLQVVVLTSSSDVQTAIAAANLGALDYIVKGEKDLFPRVASAITSAIEKRVLKQQVYNLERKSTHQVSFSDIVGSSPELIEGINLAKKASNSNVPVLIDGEVGTGKELLARAIHGSGPKVGKPFIVVDCPSLNAENTDLTLFGCEKSEDLGIHERLIGKVREAEGGTLFLRNVHTLQSETQLKILRLLQDGIIRPVGGKLVTDAGVRVVSSTNVDLEAEVRHERFREDLYYCLSIFQISIPPLRERGFEDIDMLSRGFYRDFAINEGKNIKGIEEDAMSLLCSFDWEDNIRQLKNYVFKAVVLCDGEMLKSVHFPQITNFDKINRIRRRPVRLTQSNNSIDLFSVNGNCKNLEEIEVEIFTKILECFDGNLSEVSKQLKVGRSTVYRKLKPE